MLKMMVPQLKEDTVLAQDPSSVSNTPIRRLTIAYNPVPGNSTPSSGLLQHLLSHAQT